MAEARTLGQHLASRLVELGVQDFFAVPGDYNLALLDQLLKEPKLNMVNTCNELSKQHDTFSITQPGAHPSPYTFLQLQMRAMLPMAMHGLKGLDACVSPSRSAAFAGLACMHLACMCTPSHTPACILVNASFQNYVRPSNGCQVAGECLSYLLLMTCMH